MILLVAASLLVPGDCRSEKIESSATSLAEVLRPEAVVQLEAEWDPSWGRTYASITLGDDGQIQARVHAERPDDEGTDDFGEALIDALLQAPDEELPWRFVVAEDGQARLRLAQEFRVCPPVMKDRDDHFQAIRRARSGFSIPRPVTLVVNAFVNREGRVEEIHVMESTGDFDLDLALRNVVWGMEFEPARLEDVVVEVWTRFPITINPSRGGGH